MKKVKVKIPAKINLTLDVIGVKDGYHQIESLFSSIALFDYVIIKKRKDDKITLKEKGIKAGVEVFNNNAYKTAELFRTKTGVSGVDVIVKKNIPVGGGLGGSSADVAGVLKGMQKLFNTQENLTDLASHMGSDCAYMLNGKYALVEGRGEKTTPVHGLKRLNILLITSKNQVSAKQSYCGFDELNIATSPCTKSSIEKFQSGDYQGFCKVIKNDLYLSSKLICEDITANLNALKNADASLMTGSGATVFGIYKDKKALNKEYNKLKKIYKNQVIKTHTII